MKKAALKLALIVCAAFSLLAVESQTPTILVKGNAIFHLGDIQIVHPIYINYYSSTVTLYYHVTFYPPELVHRWIVYSLDRGRNVTVYDEYNALESYNGSVTLSGLSAGNHTIEIYSKNGTFVFGTSIADATRGWHDAVDTAHFNVVLSGESPTPLPTVAPTSRPTATPDATSKTATFPATLIFVASVGIALAVIGLMVYFKKHK